MISDSMRSIKGDTLMKHAMAAMIILFGMQNSAPVVPPFEHGDNFEVPQHLSPSEEAGPATTYHVNRFYIISVKVCNK